jgi:hydrogenase expression/formation protein HypC
MCQAIPRRVLRVDGSRAEVDYDGVPRWVEAAIVTDLQVGDYVVVYAGQALEKMDNAEAEELLAWYASMESLLDEAEATR